MRRWFVTLVAAGLVLAVPLTVLALTLHNGTRVNHQRAVVKTKASTTSSTTFVPVRGMRSTLVCANGQVSATLTATVTGAPVEFRMRIDGGGLLDPPSAHFDPTSGTRTFSSTFVIRAFRFEGSDGHSFDLEWRSPSGAAVTLKKGAALNLLFGTGSC
jgi:hypothetical protein